MKKDPLIYITHIKSCIDKIISYTQDMDEAGFVKNSMVQDAVIRNFEIIGEATKNIDSEFRNKYPKIEWKKISGMRDKLIHDYIGVDNWAVWGVVKNIIPEFSNQINDIIATEGNGKKPPLE